MSEQSQISPLNGIMDTDAYPKYVNTDTGHVALRENLRAGGSRGKKFINRKLKGTLLVDVELPETGDNKCIGWCNDTQNDAIVYFVYNSSGDHCIYRYYTKTEVSQKIWFEESQLGLEDADLRAEVIEGKVYWVNGTQTPKGFNLDMAANYTAGVADDAYTSDDEPFEDNIFSLAKTPPQFAPEVKYDSDNTYNFNNLRKKLFQFKYAYQYYDNQISSWSAISKVPLPVNELGANGEFIEDIYINNKIVIKVNTGSHLVKKILLAARDTSPRNSGSFFRFDKINKNNPDGEQIIGDESDYVVSFYNNKNTENIDTDINNRYCDWVPFSGKDLKILDGKYIGIAYPEQGYDEVIPNYTLTAVNVELETETDITQYNMVTKRGISKVRYTLTWISMDTIEIPLTFYPDSIYSISFSVMGVNIIASQSTGASDASYPASVRDALADGIRAQVAGLSIDEKYIEGTLEYHFPIGWSSNQHGISMTFWDTDEHGNWIKNWPISNLQGTIITNVSVSLESIKSLKRGQYHPFGIIYNDIKGRYNVVFTDPDGSELYSPLATDGTEEQLKQSVRCMWNIFHRPPLWADTYRWCYIRNKSYSYFQYFAYVKSTLGDGSNSIPPGKYFLELNQSLERIRELFPNFVISDYVWQNGDRIRLIGSDKSYEILSEYTWVDEAEGEDAEGVTGVLIDTALETHSEVLGRMIAYLSLVEVYQQNPSPQETIYLEIGEEYEIIDAGTANRRHAGQVTDQNVALTIPAVGIMDFGDVYLRQRLVADEAGAASLPVIIEDEYFNDFYRSDAIDVGRAGAKIETENKFLNRVVRSENFIENTEYNLLNVWMPDTEYFDASDEFGAITGIENVGDVLKVIQPHKETSVYIGKNYVKQADGNEIVVASDNVFNSPNRYIEFRGTIYRKSLLSNRRYLYYFDESTGEFIRSSANGQMAISSYYRMRTEFETLAKTLREYNGNKDVMVGANNDNDEIYITFRIGDDYTTYVFSEEEENKGWVYKISLENVTGQGTENYANFGDIMFSFLNGSLWMHDQNETLNLFYDKQHTAVVEYYVNKYPNWIKRFKNIKLSTNKNLWYIEMTIPTGLNYGNQKTYLRPTILREREGQIVKDILRNVLNRKGIEDLNLLYKGERMVGEYMKVRLSDSTSQDVELREVEVKFLIST